MLASWRGDELVKDWGDHDPPDRLFRIEAALLTAVVAFGLMAAALWLVRAGLASL
jgi:hypothetical protein